jgi:hypothetical protein
VKEYLILRLRNAAIACDQRKDHALAELLTEAIDELEGATHVTYGEAVSFDKETDLVDFLIGRKK